MKEKAIKIIEEKINRIAQFDYRGFNVDTAEEMLDSFAVETEARIDFAYVIGLITKDEYRIFNVRLTQARNDMQYQIDINC